MSSGKHLFVASVVALLVPLALRAEKASDLSPTKAPAQPPSFRADFASGQLGKPFVVSKGAWEIQDGALTGREKSDDMHAAVLSLQQPFRNGVLRFSFKLDGATGFNVSLNHAKGHLFRVQVAENGLTILKDKDKKDDSSKPAVLGKAGGKISSSEWHTMLLEIQGDTVKVKTDNGVSVQGKDSSLDVDKTGYRFVMKKGPLWLDDITVWKND